VADLVGQRMPQVVPAVLVGTGGTRRGHAHAGGVGRGAVGARTLGVCMPALACAQARAALLSAVCRWHLGVRFPPF
jgi:hypothetical protein